ncbi:MAG: response regulator [Rickettsiales bacterium]|nr:response regulator [Rickettsiales bacterium]
MSDTEKPKKVTLEDRLRRVHIVVADNDQRVANLIKSMLEAVGFRKITIARDGYEVMATLTRNNVHLLITDWSLKPSPEVELPEEFKAKWKLFPVTNGCSLIECIRHDRGSPSPFLPVIIMTPPTKPGAILSARDAGVHEILVKPLTAQLLFDRLTSVIERPRIFITSADYKGPCRRRKYQAYKGQERRKRNVQVVRFSK